MDDTNQPITLKEENIPEMMARHQGKIDHAIGYDAETQQKRLKLFDRDPAAIAAHYPELQAKSEELRQRNDAIQGTASTVGWLSAAGAAAATVFAVQKKKFGENRLIQGIMVVLSSITAGFAGNALTNWALGGRVRAESKDLAEASRIALEREYAVNMEDTQQKIATRFADEREKAASQAADGAIAKASQSAEATVQTANDAIERAKASAAPKMAESHTAALTAARQQEAARETALV